MFEVSNENTQEIEYVRALRCRKCIHREEFFMRRREKITENLLHNQRFCPHQDRGRLLQAESTVMTWGALD